MLSKKNFFWVLLLFEVYLAVSYFLYGLGFNPCTPGGFGFFGLIWGAVCSENFKPNNNVNAYIVFLMTVAAALIIYLFIKLKRET